MSKIELNQDDVFLLGNIAMKGISIGMGEDTYKMSQVVRERRPDNAGGALIDALRLAMKGERAAAIKELEEANVFAASANREEALIFFLSLLVEEKQFERAKKLATELAGSGIEFADSTQEALAFFVSIDPSKFERPKAKAETLR